MCCNTKSFRNKFNLFAVVEVFMEEYRQHNKNLSQIFLEDMSKCYRHEIIGVCTYINH